MVAVAVTVWVWTRKDVPGVGSTPREEAEEGFCTRRVGYVDVSRRDTNEEREPSPVDQTDGLQ